MYKIVYFTPSSEDVERFDAFVQNMGGDVQQSSTGLFDVDSGLRYNLGVIKAPHFFSSESNIKKGSGFSAKMSRLSGKGLHYKKTVFLSAKDVPGKLVATITLYVRKLPFGRSWLYCPRGPGWKELNSSIWDALFHHIQAIAIKERAIFLRVEPNESTIFHINANEYRPVHNHSWSGITEFKLKFGGRIIQYHPAVEYVFQMPWYCIFLAGKKLSFAAKKLCLATNRFCFSVKKPKKENCNALDDNSHQKLFKSSKIDSSKNFSDFWHKNGFRLAHQHYQPEWTNMIDLSLPEEKILQQMKPKGRYNIRLAQKKGVKSLLWKWDRERELHDPTFLKAEEAGRVFFQLFEETTTRDGFHGHDADYYTRFLMTSGDFGLGKLFIAYMPHEIENKQQISEDTIKRDLQEKDSTRICHISRDMTAKDSIGVHDKNVAHSAFSSSEQSFPREIVKKIGGVPIAAIIVTHFGDRATYFYGASSNRHRDLMAPYLLQWTAMLDAKKHGYLWYDLFGIAPSST
ncbi:peptidoglycan bridge formation glycyltransferase FemA/FemB family protein [Candidatus Peregrinibacteria bacterium]|nr:peptidoglycan bridge formation glycyltransferase FemA/FemB family protein [Candidatus Peregrinibacteria bacterium]